MATIECIHKLGGVNNVVSVSWFNIPANSDGGFIEMPNHSDKTVQFFGVFGGATSKIQGSNDERVMTDYASSIWYDLTDVNGMAVSKSSAGASVIMENPRYVRSIVTGGDGTTSITIVICAKRG